MLREIALEPFHIWQLRLESRTSARDFIRIGPRDEAFIREAFPRETRSRISFALRRDIAVRNYPVRFNTVFLDDLFHQCNHGLNLRFRIVNPLLAISCSFVS